MNRWTAADPAGLIDGPNVYAYVGGNPINSVDVLGLMAEVITLGCFCAAADGPFPVGDVIAVVVIGGGLVYMCYQRIPKRPRYKQPPSYRPPRTKPGDPPNKPPSVPPSPPPPPDPPPPGSPCTPLLSSCLGGNYTACAILFILIFYNLC